MSADPTINLLWGHFYNIVQKTWNFSGRLDRDDDHYSNAAMGLASEAGEAADNVKKFLYHSMKGTWAEHRVFYRAKIVLELGDVLYYMLKLMHVFSISFEEVIDGNRAKLESRHPELGKVTERFGVNAIK